MMAENPDKAIEKLTKYREESKTKQDTIQSEKKDLSPAVKKVRKFFIQFHWFNAVFVAAIGFILVSMTFLRAPAWIILAVLEFVILRQIFATIDRLDESDGRDTTFDDVFVIIMTAVSFLALLPFRPSFFTFSIFQIIHGFLAVLWVGQILFVNYFKPELQYAMLKGEDIEHEASMFDLTEYFTSERLVVIGIALIIAIIYTILV